MRVLDIGIAGCGPAGLASALLLERQGHRVTLVERFDAARPLGSGLILQPTGLAVLRELGLAERLIAQGSRIDRLFGLSAATGSVVLDVRYAPLGPEVFGLGIHRASLFETLFGAAAATGVRIRTAAEVTDLDRHGDGRSSFVTAQGRRIGPFDLLIDASGARSPLLRHAERAVVPRPLCYGALWTNVRLGDHGLQPNALEQRYRRASVMVGVLPIGRLGEGGEPFASLFWSLKPERYDAWRAAGLDAWKAQVLRHWPQVAPLLAQIGDPEQLLLASYRHQTLPVPHGAGIAFVGDCAHATSPQLGQGANMALLDALALATALEQTGDPQAALGLYARLRRWHVRFYQAASLLFTPFYQSDGTVLPAIRDRLVPPLARLPGIDRMLALLVAGRIAAPFRGIEASRRGMAARGTG